MTTRDKGITLSYKNRYLNVQDIQFGAKGNGIDDDTAAIQAAINLAASDTLGGAQSLYLPSGIYKLSSKLVIPKKFIGIRGEHQFSSQLNYAASVEACIQPAAMTFFNPLFDSFSIQGAPTSGIGIDCTNIVDQVYDGSFNNMYIHAGQQAIYAPRLFSFSFDTVIGNSYNNHAFHVYCGPGTHWANCYAEEAGAGFGGYRLAGHISMYSCNGVNDADYWGIFGNDPTVIDGFENDFVGFDYPDINLISSNIEQFTIGGLRCQSAFRRFKIDGGKFDRAGLATPWQYLVYSRAGSINPNQPVEFGAAVFYPHVPPVVPSLGYLVSGNGAIFEDTNGALAAQPSPVTTYYDQTAALNYPLIVPKAVQDIFQGNAQSFNALTSRRFSARIIRFEAPAPLTPVGAAQAIDVTGYTKVIVTPAAAASISTATFDQTPGAELDYLRNGDLIIEAGNGNLTIDYSAVANGFRTALNATAGTLVMSAGQIARFTWSEVLTCWQQV